MKEKAAGSRLLDTAADVNCMQVDNPVNKLTMVWKCIVTGQRKRAIMSCFRMLPVYKLDRSVATPPPLLFCLPPFLTPRYARYVPR